MTTEGGRRRRRRKGRKEGVREINEGVWLEGSVALGRRR